MTTNTPSTAPTNEVSVEIRNGKATTTSLDVATHFGKLHKDVLKRIANLDCSAEFTERNFALSEYTDPSGRKLTQYRMTRDGFVFLCMGFTGKEAAKWKESYINAFNQMEQTLVEQPEMLSHGHLLKFAQKTLELMRDRSTSHPPRPSTEQVVLNYLAIESLDQANPEQVQKAIIFLQGQIIGEGSAAKTLPGVAGSSIAKDLLYGLLRSSHDAELLFNSLYDSGVEKLASEIFKNHMANKLAETSQQARDLLGYVSSHATRNPFTNNQSKH